MIQKTDLMILVVATAGLSVGIFRWYENTQNVSAVTIPASSKVVIPAPEMPPEPTNMTVSVAANDTSANNGSAEAVVAKQIEESHSIEPAQDEFMEYVVRSGDVLSRIAVQHDTDVATLQRLNKMSGTAIYPGQTLIYPLAVN